ncbi:MAG: 2-phospho-L-lactate guanylyltransferase [Candidatus Dormibacteria bacterium]
MILRPFLVIPVKPSSGSKQRLAAALTDSGREMVSLSLAVRVISLASQVWPKGQVVVVSAEPALVPLCARLGVARLPDPGNGQTAAVRSGVCWSLERGGTVVATVAADLPALRAADLLEVLQTAHGLAAGSMVVYPDRDGSGTNGVVVRPATILVHSFGPGSRHRHEQIARRLGLEFRALVVPGLSWDLDRPEDLDPSGDLDPHPVVTWALQVSGRTPLTVEFDG